MGKKGSWFSAIKRVFTSSSKEKLVNEAEKEKKGKGRLKYGGKRSFFREPSSIEKILGEVDQQNLFSRHPTVTLSQSHQPSSSGRSASPPRVASPRISSARVTSPRAAAASPRTSSPRVVGQQTKISYTSEPTLQHHVSATRIQAAYRGFMARRSFRGLTGLVRLQGVVRGQHVKRQTVNAMKQMQLLVRVQTQIQSRRIQMLETQALKRQHNNNNDKQLDGKNLLEMGDEEWDDSLVTKEEREARLQRKVEAVIKRERAMAYAYSYHQTPKSGSNSVMDIRSGGYPWWWNWLERQLPSSDIENPTPNHKPSPRRPESSSHQDDTPTPRSSRSMVPLRSRQQMKYSKARASPSPSPSSTCYPMKDDDSLMSCPPFSVPNYMSPTVSAKAKARPTSNPRDRLPSTPGSESSKRRFSFPQTPNIIVNGSFKGTQIRHKSPGSVGDFSMDSAISMPATVGRKPFNRFV